MDACPEDLDWMAFLEGASARREQLEAHRAGCATCRATVDAARTALAALEGLSPGSRRLCPPSDELAEVPTGMARLSVRLHVALCAPCREDLADLAALEEEAPAEVLARWLDDGFRVVSQTLSSLAPEAVLAPAARGPSAAPGWRMRRELPDGALTLELAPGEGRAFALSVSLSPTPPAGTRVDLEADERLLESRRMEAGLISFFGLAPGRYRVSVRRPRAPAVVTELDVAG